MEDFCEICFSQSEISTYHNVSVCKRCIEKDKKYTKAYMEQLKEDAGEVW